MVKSVDKRSAMERLQCAFEQSRGTQFVRRDVVEIWREILRLRRIEIAACAVVVDQLVRSIEPEEVW